MNQPASPMKSSKALFISDLHLQAGAPKTIAAFQKFLEKKATQAEQLYILGDLFEYWVGDDDMDSEAVQVIVGAIRQVSDRGTAVFWIPGNRDLLTRQKIPAIHRRKSTSRSGDRRIRQQKAHAGAWRCAMYG